MTIFKQDENFLKRCRRDALAYTLVNILIVLVVGYLILDKELIGQYVASFINNIKVLGLTATVIFIFVNYERWKHWKGLKHIPELTITSSEVKHICGLLEERIKTTDIVKVEHVNKGKKGECINIKLSNGQSVIYNGFENMEQLHNQIQSVSQCEL